MRESMDDQLENFSRDNMRESIWEELWTYNIFNPNAGFRLSPIILSCFLFNC
jgi:hypothetical protein